MPRLKRMQRCDECRKRDSDPRHVNVDLLTPSPGHSGKAIDVHHLDCGALAGCAVCIESEARTAGARGAALDLALDRVLRGD